LLLAVLVAEPDTVVEVVLEVIEQQDLDQVHYEEQH
jgi:hypothetical protein